MYGKGRYLEHPESLDKFGIRRDSGCPGENYDSTVGSHKDQLPNLETVILSQGGSELFN